MPSTVRGPRASAVGLLCLALACGDRGTTPSPVVTPTPSPTPGAGPTPGAATGPTRITFVAAEPSPGANVAGCGASAIGCAGRIRMRFALLSPVGGPVMYVRVFLHETSQRACLLGQSGPSVLRAGQTEDVEVVLDQADQCRTPSDIRTMAAVVEGTIEVASRQEWGIRYTLSP